MKRIRYRGFWIFVIVLGLIAQFAQTNLDLGLFANAEQAQTQGAQVQLDDAKPSKAHQRMNRKQAIASATVFAYEKGLIPIPVEILVKEQENEEWMAFVSWGFITRIDGTLASPSPSGIPARVWVTRDGHTASAHEGGVDNLVDESGEPITFVNKKVARLLAKAYAIKFGLMASEMKIEAHETENNGWMVGLFPGVQCKPQSDELQMPFPLCTVVLIDALGKCSLVPIG